MLVGRDATTLCLIMEWQSKMTWGQTCCMWQVFHACHMRRLGSCFQIRRHESSMMYACQEDTQQEKSVACSWNNGCCLRAMTKSTSSLWVFNLFASQSKISCNQAPQQKITSQTDNLTMSDYTQEASLIQLIAGMWKAPWLSHC